MSLYSKIKELIVFPLVLAAALSGEAGGQDKKGSSGKGEDTVVFKDKKDVVLNPFQHTKDPLKRVTSDEKDNSLTLTHFKGEIPTLAIRGVREVLVPDKDDPADIDKAIKQKAIRFGAYHDLGGKGIEKYHLGYVPYTDELVIKTNNLGVAVIETSPEESRDKEPGLKPFKGKINVECGKGLRSLTLAVDNPVKITGMPKDQIKTNLHTGDPILIRGNTIKMNLAEMIDIDPEKCGKDDDKYVIKKKDGSLLVESDGPFHVDVMDGGKRHSTFRIGEEKPSAQKTATEVLKKAVEDAGKKKERSDNRRLGEAEERRFVGRVDERDFDRDGRV